jgi:hypothetical protein
MVTLNHTVDPMLAQGWGSPAWPVPTELTRMLAGIGSRGARSRSSVGVVPVGAGAVVVGSAGTVWTGAVCAGIVLAGGAVVVVVLVVAGAVVAGAVVVDDAEPPGAVTVTWALSSAKRSTTIVIPLAASVNVWPAFHTVAASPVPLDRIVVVSVPAATFSMTTPGSGTA